MRKENKNIIKAFIGLFIAIICSGLVSIWLVFYGPLTTVKELFVTTAMTTFKHQYLARIFVSDQEIERIMEKNSIGEIIEETDTTKIMIPSDDEVLRLEREAQIERKRHLEKYWIAQIFEKQSAYQKDIQYKEISGKSYKGWLIMVKDPSRVILGSTENLGKRGMRLDQIIKRYDAVAGINAGGFSDDEGHGSGGVPTGLIIENFKVLYQTDSSKYGIIGFDRFNRLILGNYTLDEIKSKEIRDAISFGPFLIVNGKPSIKRGNGGRGLQPRTAIGQKADGTVIMLAIDGRQVTSVGATLRDVQDIMLQYGAVNAANLDGGSSTTIFYNGKIMNSPCGPSGARYLPSAFIIKK